MARRSCRCVLAALAVVASAGVTPEASVRPAGIEPLPPPDRAGARSLESLLQARRSVRDFAPDTLDARQVGQLLWATGGVTETRGFARRTAPSAGALYPLEIHLVTARGVARYDPSTHALAWELAGDRRDALAEAAYGQDWLGRAPAVIVIAAEPGRTARKYGARADRYVALEAGGACQNLLLEAVALGLGATPVGAFDDAAVGRLLGFAPERHALLVVPVGRPRQRE
jgi:SagB-type dehydrogenase family enzyme